MGFHSFEIGATTHINLDLLLILGNPVMIKKHAAVHAPDTMMKMRNIGIKGWSSGIRLESRWYRAVKNAAMLI